MCGGGIFRAVPREFDPESGSHRLPFAGSIRLIDWRVTLSGTMLDVTPENLARLLPSDTEMTERVTTLTRASRFPAYAGLVRQAGGCC